MHRLGAHEKPGRSVILVSGEQFAQRMPSQPLSEKACGAEAPARKPRSDRTQVCRAEQPTVLRAEFQFLDRLAGFSIQQDPFQFFRLE